ncbi:VanW family protein [Candidatus Uhrbacteria bacterium]|nr:VanW family protein [Candidatus Uhrbacteria bacterium]
MHEHRPEDKHAASNTFSGTFWIITKVMLVSVLSGILFFTTGLYLWAQSFEGRIPPNTSIAQMHVSGMDPEDVRQKLQEKIDTVLTQGIQVTFRDHKKTLDLATLASSDAREDVIFDLDTALSTAMRPHARNVLADAWNMFIQLTQKTEIAIPLSLQEDRLKTNISSLYPDAEHLAKNAGFLFTRPNNQWEVTVQAGTTGGVFKWNAFFETLSQHLSLLDTSTIELSLENQLPTVSKGKASGQKTEALAALNTAPYTVVLPQEETTWELTAETLSQMLEPGAQQIQLSEEQLEAWIQPIADQTDHPAQNARLNIENGRVVDFVESKEGKRVDVTIMKELLTQAVQSASSQPIELALQIEEPEVKTQDVNNLGITQILGTGTSSYRGSPVNRRGNIQNGVSLLDGLLIAPGETFSLIKALAPFTSANGYLPELVIKGEKIEPEMGGGLCQIGTTTFRSVMNSGLPVVERRNHSLVVSYYNDPGNGNPGTDATIYEPSPDFKFTNDTGHYILFQAKNLTDTQELEFTLWGTSDGRVGSYTPPVVSRWIPVGETKRIETTDLEPGKQKCQSAHIGADTSFVYTVIGPDGEKEETLFESHYRPLPEICLVGVEPVVEEETGENSETSVPTDTEKKPEES